MKHPEKNKNRKPLKKRGHPFSEELSDGRERDRIIKQQNSKGCGGL